MATHTPSGFIWVEAEQPREARRRARVIASFADYLAEYVHRNPDRVLDAMAALGRQPARRRALDAETE
jgi:hypothetical protein